MIILCCNARGLRGQRAFQSLNCLIIESFPDLLFILELKLYKLFVNILRYRLNLKNCFCVNPLDKEAGSFYCGMT